MHQIPVYPVRYIKGDFLDLISGNVIRTDPEAITLFKSVGLAIWDLIVAEMIFSDSI